MANSLYIKGGRKHERAICEAVAIYCCKKLLPKVRSLEIEIELKNIKGDVVGYCMMEDDNKTYTIEIQKGMSVRQLVTTVAHEMVHVKQYYRKEMNDQLTSSGRAKWKGKTVDADTDYMDLPWEKEAFRLQETLADDMWKNDLI